MILCAAGAYCGDGVCVAARTTAGEACDDPAACLAPLTCNLATMKCERVAYIEPGGICLDSAGGGGLCRASTCAVVIGDGGVRGTCEPFGKEGDPCNYV